LKNEDSSSINSSSISSSSIADCAIVLELIHPKEFCTADFEVDHYREGVD